jgi:hypothetical protein
MRTITASRGENFPIGELSRRSGVNIETIRRAWRHPSNESEKRGSEIMMHDMMGGMGWGMGVIGLLVIVLLVLGIAALVKYLRSG